jgi:hypothetical protein
MEQIRGVTTLTLLNVLQDRRKCASRQHVEPIKNGKRTPTFISARIFHLPFHYIIIVLS